MDLEWEQVVIKALHPQNLGRWWSDALGWIIVNDDPEEFEIQCQADQRPGILFLRARDPKRLGNRLHLDFRPKDQRDEVERLLSLGATPVDIGQGEVSWVVLADPEGNEFCVLQERRTEASDESASGRDIPRTRTERPSTGLDDNSMDSHGSTA